MRINTMRISVLPLLMMVPLVQAFEGVGSEIRRDEGLMPRAMYETKTVQLNGEDATITTLTPSKEPSSTPSVDPSDLPSGPPLVHSKEPSSFPSSVPSSEQSLIPSVSPTFVPTFSQTEEPSSAPSDVPSTVSPSNIPSGTPTASISPSDIPSLDPSLQPTLFPSNDPSSDPSSLPSDDPSSEPSSEPTSFPSNDPSSLPSVEPSILPSVSPSSVPTISFAPSSMPSLEPSHLPSFIPSADPSKEPSNEPTSFPSVSPSVAPSEKPTLKPTMSMKPSTTPTSSPSVTPTTSAIPSDFPSRQPSKTPSFIPSNYPSKKPSSEPSALPSALPSRTPSNIPSTGPTVSLEPSSLPSSRPSTVPSFNPTRSEMPSESPSNDPSQKPSLSFLRTRNLSTFVTLGFEKLTPLDDTAKEEFEKVARNFLNTTKLESENERVNVDIKSVSLISQNMQDKTNQDKDVVDSVQNKDNSSRNLEESKDEILLVRIKVNGEASSYQSKALDDYDFETVLTLRFETNFSNFTQALSQSPSSQFDALESSNGRNDIGNNDGFKMDMTIIIMLAVGGGLTVIILSVALTIMCMKRRERHMECDSEVDGEEIQYGGGAYNNTSPGNEQGSASFGMINYSFHHNGAADGSGLEKYNSNEHRLGAVPASPNAIESGNSSDQSWRDPYRQGQRPLHEDSGLIERQYVSAKAHVLFD